MKPRPKCEECGLELQYNDAVAEVGALQYAHRKVYHVRCFVKATRCYEELAAANKIVDEITADKDPRQIDLEDCISRAGKA